MLYRLISRSDRSRFCHIVVSMVGQGPIAERLRASGVRVYTLGMQRGRPSASGILKLRSILRNERPNVLQTWQYHANLLGVLVSPWSGGAPVVWNVRASNVDASKYHWLSGLVMRFCVWLSGLPQVVVVNSEDGRFVHTNLGYRPRQWKVIPNGFDLNEWVPDPLARRSVRGTLGLSGDTLLIGLVARYDPMKDHPTFLRAAARLASVDPNVHFLLVGEDVTMQNEMLATLVAQLRLEGRVHLLGYRADVSYLNAALDIATSSSYGEGFSNTIGEAMACGVPCVVTDVGDSARIVGDTGLVVFPEDPEALAEGWLRLIELGEDGRRALGQRARQRIEQHYSLSCIVQQYEALYTSIVEA